MVRFWMPGSGDRDRHRAARDEQARVTALRVADLPLPAAGPPMLVTGSSGRLGRALAARLDPLEVRGLDVEPGPATTVRGSILDRRALAEALAGVDSVVHLAALHAPHIGRVPDRQFRTVNVDGTASLLAAARKAGVRRFVFASSTSVYGAALANRSAAVYVTESLAVAPRDVYDDTKRAAERLVLAADGDFPDGTVVLRIGRCVRETARLRAWHRFYRGLAAADAARALHRAARSGVGGVFNVVARTLLQAEDAAGLKDDPLAILRQRYPAFDWRDEDWAVLARDGIDRVYDGSLAATRLGFASRWDTVAWHERAMRRTRVRLTPPTASPWWSA
ncbi:NAD-dependent epimerase/dehydratase family protein [Mongoliimonas terrestris]|uniref:NAD-dependent epimerase/dehydratase family protein n=1 Tax=Mongoliimonas terrestris TaxID=1709001 RepID=UPI000949A203|nr:NAD(P)-dependent oxidoreductase [Mongoliimonas terrestris]